jgi:hypothetical protein
MVKTRSRHRARCGSLNSNGGTVRPGVLTGVLTGDGTAGFGDLIRRNGRALAGDSERFPAVKLEPVERIEIPAKSCRVLQFLPINPQSGTSRTKSADRAQPEQIA